MGGEAWCHFTPFEKSVQTALEKLRVSRTPGSGAVCPLSDADLESYFGTTEPTREIILANRDFLGPIERGRGIYVTVYKNGRPSEYFFAGFSVD